MLSRIVFAAALLALAAPSFAAEEEESDPWAGKVYLGYLASSGNTDPNLTTPCCEPICESSSDATDGSVQEEVA